MNIPRSEHPNPQFMREDWVNLNGIWDFEIDHSKSGMDREFFKRKKFDEEIIVPFCPESELSGVNHKDFMECVWYGKEFNVSEKQKGKNVILHFGAVDYNAIVFVNGEKVGEHKGGYTSFSFDITKYVKENNYIVVCAYDYLRTNKQPMGKQCFNFYSRVCSYTRTTGIWQTVWLEYVNPSYVKSVKIDTNIDAPSASFELRVADSALNKVANIKVLYEGKEVGKAKTVLYSLSTTVGVSLSEKHLWEVGCGRLYDVIITLENEGEVLDSVSTYFGLRSVCLDKRAFKINGKAIFGRWVLDQGFYPDGIYTAPTDEALKFDIEASMKLGFNGARLHEKVFEPRFLYWADKLGYTVWGEHANWGLDITEFEGVRYFLPEWVEAVERDYNHPSIIGWCPFNETWDNDGRKQCDDVVKMIYDMTKALDKTRPVIDTSGNFHVVTDIFDVHDYEQRVELFSHHYDKLTEGILEDTTYRNDTMRGRQNYDGNAPTFVSEYGGIKWDIESDDKAWGYGDAPTSEEEFIERYRGLTQTLLNNEYMLGFCYTQLYDIEQERNGLLTYNREFKFDPEIFRKINSQKAAIED